MAHMMGNPFGIAQGLFGAGPPDCMKLCLASGASATPGLQDRVDALNPKP